MRRRGPHPAFSALAATILFGGCASGGTTDGPVVVQPGAPGRQGRVLPADATANRPTYSEADVHFMHGMIPHHAQALEMVALAPSRAASEAVRAMALRMEISQRDEIALIERWLRARGQATTMTHDMGMMPGMLTPEEMDRLRSARGAEFDRLFLEGMIRHHEGAITMVQTLFATSGAGQDSEIFQFANDVETDQKIEIDRMMGLLQSGGAR